MRRGRCEAARVAGCRSPAIIAMLRTRLGDARMSVQSSPGGRGSVVAGIGLAASAYLLFSLQDATIKWLATGFTAPQILLMRSLVIVPLCIALGGPKLVVRAVVSPIRLQLVLRSLVLLAAWSCYYSAARYLQLAEMPTLYFSSPLLVAALALPVLKERVPWSRWASLALGCAGVVIACRPAALFRADLSQTGPILLVLAAALW